jgi:hypothetical protein
MRSNDDPIDYPGFPKAMVEWMKGLYLPIADPIRSHENLCGALVEEVDGIRHHLPVLHAIINRRNL